MNKISKIFILSTFVFKLGAWGTNEHLFAVPAQSQQRDQQGRAPLYSQNTPLRAASVPPRAQVVQGDNSVPREAVVVTPGPERGSRVVNLMGLTVAVGAAFLFFTRN